MVRFMMFYNDYNKAALTLAEYGLRSLSKDGKCSICYRTTPYECYKECANTICANIIYWCLPCAGKWYIAQKGNPYCSTFCSNFSKAVRDMKVI